MKNLLPRLREYARLAWRMATYGLLLAFWGVVLVAFCAHVGPRLGYLAGRPIGDDLPCHTPECDFSVFWPAGILARAGDFAALYDRGSFATHAAAMLGTSGYIMPFLYPPPMLLFMAGISHLPFEWAAFIWTLGLLAISAALLRLARFSWPVILLGLASPAALNGLQIGQVGVICDSILVAGLALAAARPLTGGALLGLLAAKPQVGLLVPFTFLARRQWRAAAAFAVSVVVFCGLVTAFFGLAPWRAFFAADHSQVQGMLNAPFDPHTYQGWGVSTFWMARSFGLGIGAAKLLQAGIGLAAIAGIFAAAKRNNFLEIAICLSLLASPYGFAYGMVAFSLMLAVRAERNGWRIGMLDTLCWLWPGFCLVVSIATGHELTPLIVLLALWRAWRVALPSAAPVLPGAPIGA
jgi:hypothetical protein